MTVVNFLRLVAVVIMRGLALARDDATFFRGERRGSYTRTGAEGVCGPSPCQDQQLLRHVHLVRSVNRPSSKEKDYDKCFFLRPLITLLQQAFAR